MLQIQPVFCVQNHAIRDRQRQERSLGFARDDRRGKGLAEKACGQGHGMPCPYGKSGRGAVGRKQRQTQRQQPKQQQIPRRTEGILCRDDSAKARRRQQPNQKLLPHQAAPKSRDDSAVAKSRRHFTGDQRGCRKIQSAPTAESLVNGLAPEPSAFATQILVVPFGPLLSLPSKERPE